MDVAFLNADSRPSRSRSHSTCDSLCELQPKICSHPVRRELASNFLLFTSNGPFMT
jgi:hypothetical protein